MRTSIKIAIAVLGLEGIAVTYFAAIKPQIDQDRFYELYQKAVSHYMSTNHVQVLTSQDMESINQGFLGRHNARYIYDSLPSYNDGKSIPMDSLKAWSDEYDGK